MSQAQKDYSKLHEMGRHARILLGVAHLLDWDQETYMPSGAAEIRGEQLKTLAGIIHKEKTGKKFSSTLAKLIDFKTDQVVDGLTEEQTASIKEWKRDYIKAKALPKKFVENSAKLSSQAILAWREAKKTNKFSHFAPYLNKLVTMARKKADYFGYQGHPYDALLDEYEPGAIKKEISTLFGSLRTNIVNLLNKIKVAKPIDDHFLHGKFPHEKQLEFAKTLLVKMGYDDKHGRLDLSTHPFSSAFHPTDSRITTRIHDTSLMSCINVILHEAGHALYEMGLPSEHFGSPLGDAISLGVHESQSRWWETRIGQSKPFCRYLLPLLQNQFGGNLQTVQLDDFYRAVNKVHPSLIRVEADEVTYPLHVILRFELEQALIGGQLKVKDVPEAWNAKMKELLNITPQNNAEGCLQDIHWSMGAFGYFPTYTLGNLYAAQFFDAFVKQNPEWEKKVAEGELMFIVEWLKDNVHRHGKRYSSQELITKISGKPFTADAYVNYLTNKYQGIYQLVN